MATGFDNRVFDVNGQSLETLRLAFQLAYAQDWDAKAKAWKYDPEFGIIFFWHHVEGTHPFPVPLTADESADIAFAWLNSDEAKTFDIKSYWHKDADHDGSNSKGWRAYVNDWGHVGNSSAGHYALLAVHPSYLWHGK